MNYKAIENKVKELVIDVGAWIRNERLNFNYDKIEIKGLNDLVSYVDKTSEEKLVNGLKSIIPNSGFRRIPARDRIRVAKRMSFANSKQKARSI